jgi:hypothetical protein
VITVHNLEAAKGKIERKRLSESYLKKQSKNEKRKNQHSQRRSQKCVERENCENMEKRLGVDDVGKYVHYERRCSPDLLIFNEAVVCSIHIRVCKY